MKKQFLAIALLLSCVQVSKPMDFEHSALVLVAAGAVASRGAEFYFRQNPNQPGLLTNAGSYVGMQGKDVAKLVTASLIMGGLAKSFPDTLSNPLAVAAGLGATALTLKAALGDHNQETNPLRINSIGKWVIIGGAAGACYNNVPVVKYFVNGILGRTATHGFYQL